MFLVMSYFRGARPAPLQSISWTLEPFWKFSPFCPNFAAASLLLAQIDISLAGASRWKRININSDKYVIKLFTVIAVLWAA